MLRTLADETMLVAVAACNLAAGSEFTSDDKARLLVAAERIQRARSLALGER